MENIDDKNSNQSRTASDFPDTTKSHWEAPELTELSLANTKSGSFPASEGALPSASVS